MALGSFVQVEGWLDQQKWLRAWERNPRNEGYSVRKEHLQSRDWVVYMPGLTRILVTVSRVSPRSYLSIQEWKCRGYGWRGRLDLLRTSGNVDSMWCPPTDHVVQISSKAFYSLELLNLVVTLSCLLFFLNKFYLFYFYLFLAVLGLCCCAWAFSSCGERGLLFVAVRGLLIAVASLVAEHGL